MKPVRSVNRYVVFIAIVLAGSALDLWSKDTAFKPQEEGGLGYPGQTEWLLDGWVKFKLHTSFNTGALWGIGQGQAWLFALLSVVAFFGVLYWLFVAGACRSLWLTITLALVTAGTLGNLYDRMALHGWKDKAGEPFQAVRDFLRFRFGTFEWATFNVADILLVVGAIMLVIQSFFQPNPQTEVAASPAKDSASANG